MGYRSQVKYIIYDTKELGGMKNYISYLLLQNDEDINNALKTIKVSDNYNYMLFERDWIKWYDEYKEIQAHKRIFSFDFQYFNNSNPDIIFTSLFIRIGEDYSDSEIINYESCDGITNELFEKLYISRTICLELSSDDNFSNIKIGLNSSENKNI